MKKELTVTGKTKAGQEITATVMLEKGVRTKTAYADGENIDTGQEAYRKLTITLSVDGKLTATTNNAPGIITPKGYGKHYAQLKAAGAHANLGDKYIAEEMYNKIAAALEEAEAATDSKEYTEQKQKEEEAERAADRVEQEYQEHYNKVKRAMEI